MVKEVCDCACDRCKNSDEMFLFYRRVKGFFHVTKIIAATLFFFVSMLALLVQANLI